MPTLVQGHGTAIGLSTVKVVADDISTLNRLAGFIEYKNALSNLDSFLKSATPEEFDAANRIVQDRDEFAIYVELSRFLDPNPTVPVAGEDYQRRGLAWVSATARVELQAMLAAFTSQKRPFAVMPPTPLDEDAYNELVLDGMKTHVWALSRDPLLAEELKTPELSSRTLALLRRLAVVNGFMHAVETRSESELPAIDETQLLALREEYSKIRAPLVRKLENAVAKNDLTSRIGQAQAQKLIRQCNNLCAGFR